jgi:hypothetical protein
MVLEGPDPMDPERKKDYPFFTTVMIKGAQELTRGTSSGEGIPPDASSGAGGAGGSANGGGAGGRGGSGGGRGGNNSGPGGRPPGGGGGNVPRGSAGGIPNAPVPR